ncbi:hypothetical protein J6590_052009 [Homalodisca vitripennis]|nr:hypothetical protein J6590_052009 [Homalodisca vitripennis]
MKTISSCQAGDNNCSRSLSLPVGGGYSFSIFRSTECNRSEQFPRAAAAAGCCSGADAGTGSPTMAPLMSPTQLCKDDWHNHNGTGDGSFLLALFPSRFQVATQVNRESCQALKTVVYRFYEGSPRYSAFHQDLAANTTASRCSPAPAPRVERVRSGRHLLSFWFLKIYHNNHTTDILRGSCKDLYPQQSHNGYFAGSCKDLYPQQSTTDIFEVPVKIYTHNNHTTDILRGSCKDPYPQQSNHGYLRVPVKLYPNNHITDILRGSKIYTHNNHTTDIFEVPKDLYPQQSQRIF